MNKFWAFVVVILLAPFIAGFYGVLHDQITYTVAPEYYTKFKFMQFGLTDLAWPDRARAAIVGFGASWWMGVPIGILVGAFGFFQRDGARMLRVCLGAMGVAVAVTLLVGLGGLAFGFFVTRGGVNRANYDGWFVPANVVHLRNYICVGYMHNASYLGGVAALVAAWIYQFVMRAKMP